MEYAVITIIIIVRTIVAAEFIIKANTVTDKPIIITTAQISWEFQINIPQLGRYLNIF